MFHYNLTLLSNLITFITDVFLSQAGISVAASVTQKFCSRTNKPFVVSNHSFPLDRISASEQIAVREVSGV